MAHTITITDGGLSINLQDTTDAGYHLISMTAPRPNRLLTRVSGYPFTDGSRVTAAALDDVAQEFLVLIVGSSADNLDLKLIALVQLLERIQRRAETGTGAVGRLLFKRSGVTNTSYRVITGVPLMPEPVDPDEIPWLDGSSTTNTLTVSFTLLLEPTAHAQLTTALLTGVGRNMTNTPGFNQAVITPLTGEMHGTYNIILTQGTATAYTTAWISIGAMSPLAFNLAGTADALAWGGTAEQLTASGTVGVSSGGGTTTSLNTEKFRLLARIKVTAGTPGKLQMRVRVRAGANIASNDPIYTPWATFTGTLNNWLLMDLGTIDLTWLQNIGNTGSTGNSATINFEYRTSDASSVTFLLDYVEMVSTVGFVKLTNVLVTTTSYEFNYDMNWRIPAEIEWPRRAPLTYVSFNNAGTHEYKAPLTRYGTMPAIDPLKTYFLWSAIQTNTVHTIADTFAADFNYLARYSLGMRGTD